MSLHHLNPCVDFIVVFAVKNFLLIKIFFNLFVNNTSVVVDVVRTDNHLQFYEDSRNMARMSDILAVYAWVDPSTGYCQGKL